MKYLIALIFLLLSLNMTAKDEFCLEEDLKKLEQTVKQKDIFEEEKQKDINNTKQLLSNCLTPEDKYNYYEQLYDKYKKWNPDSAIYYIQQGKLLAHKQGWEALYTRTCIYEAYVQVLCGNLLEASHAIAQLGDIKKMQKDNQAKMAVLMLDFCLKTNSNSLEVRNGKEALSAWANYSPYLPKNDWRYIYYKAMLLKSDNPGILIREIKGSHQPSLKVASLAIACSKIYYQQKKHNQYIHYLILSAINDIECSNREATSLLSLINSPHICLNPDQAFKYAMLCTENAHVFKDQVRSLDIVKAHAKITQNYQKRLQIKAYILTAIIGMLAIAILAIGLLLQKNRKKKKEQALLLQQVEKTNQSLQAMIEKDKVTQAQLHNANKLLRDEVNYHNQNFFNVYHLISKYIVDVQEFKKMVFNLITAGKYDKARKVLHSSSADKYLKSFFEHFDQAFLLSHPDFIERFNALLRPECRITPPETSMLTPELRIYALVSIGITDSVSIAQFLHYSTQTVYNYRLKVRHSACIEESRFADTVAKMYETD